MSVAPVEASPVPLPVFPVPPVPVDADVALADAGATVVEVVDVVVVEGRRGFRSRQSGMSTQSWRSQPRHPARSPPSGRRPPWSASGEPTQGLLVRLGHRPHDEPDVLGQLLSLGGRETRGGHDQVTLHHHVVVVGGRRCWRWRRMSPGSWSGPWWHPLRLAAAAASLGGTNLPAAFWIAAVGMFHGVPCGAPAHTEESGNTSSAGSTEPWPARRSIGFCIDVQLFSDEAGVAADERVDAVEGPCLRRSVTRCECVARRVVQARCRTVPWRSGRCPATPSAPCSRPMARGSMPGRSQLLGIGWPFAWDSRGSAQPVRLDGRP